MQLSDEQLKHYLQQLRQIPKEKSEVPVIAADLVYRIWLQGDAVDQWLSFIPRLKRQVGWSWQELRMLRHVLFCRVFSIDKCEAAIAANDPVCSVYYSRLLAEWSRRKNSSSCLCDHDWAVRNLEQNPRAVLRWVVSLRKDRLPLYGLSAEQLKHCWQRAKLHSEALSKTCPVSIYSWMQRPNIARQVKCGTLEERARSMILFAADCNLKCLSLCVAPLLNQAGQVQAGQVQALDNCSWTAKQVDKAEKRLTIFYKQEQELYTVVIDQLIARLSRNPLDSGALAALRAHQLFDSRRQAIAELLENPFCNTLAFCLLRQWRAEGYIPQAPRTQLLQELLHYPMIELKAMLGDFPQEVALVLSFHYFGNFRFFMHWLVPILRKWTTDCDLDKLTNYLGTYAVLWACVQPECSAELLNKVPAFEPWGTLFNRLLMLEKKNQH